MADRLYLDEFALANPLYAGGTVSVYTVSNGVKTSTLATLYAGLTGSTTRTNPQVLDSDGKWFNPVYIAEDVVVTISGVGVADHDTGVITVADDDQTQWIARNALRLARGADARFLMLLGGTMRGHIDLNDYQLRNAEFGATWEAVNALTSTSNTTTLDADNGANAFYHLLTENTTLALSNIPGSASVDKNWSALLRIEQTTGNSFTWDWPGACVASDGTALSQVVVTAEKANQYVLQSAIGSSQIIVTTHAEGI